MKLNFNACAAFDLKTLINFKRINKKFLILDHFFILGSRREQNEASPQVHDAALRRSLGETGRYQAFAQSRG